MSNPEGIQLQEMQVDPGGGPAIPIRRSVAAATAITLAGYATLLIQQVIYARLLGVTGSTDALAAALVWVNSVAWLVGTVFISVMVPLYARTLATDEVRAGALFGSATWPVVTIGVVLTGLTLVAADGLATLLAPGASSGSRTQVAELLRITTPAILFSVLVAVLSSLANARERYRAAAAVIAIQPVIVIVALLASTVPTVAVAGAAYSLGAGVQVLALLLAVRPWWRDLSPRLAIDAGAAIARRAVPVGLAFLFIYVASIAARGLASFGGSGAVTIVDYANRLVGAAEQAALAGFLSIALTSWSLDSADLTDRRLPTGITIRIATGVFAGAAAVGFLLAPAGVQVLFEGGSFGPADAAALSEFLRWMAPGVAGHAVLMLVIRGLLARDANWAVSGVALIQLLLFVVVGVVAAPALGINSLGLAFSVSWLASCVASLVFLESSMRVTFEMSQEVIRVGLTLLVALPTALVIVQLVEAGPLGTIVIGLFVLVSVVLLVGRAMQVTAVMMLEAYGRGHSAPERRAR